jgi:hypothetical protein
MKRALPFLAVAFCAHAALAQSATPPTRIEIMAGVNFAKLSGGGDDSDNRTGLVAGIGVIKPLADGWAFQPELTYSMKGAKATDVEGDITAKLSYIELPLLLRYEVPAQSAVRPFFHAGPALALKVGCSFEVSNGSESASQSCDDFGSDAKSFDLGLMFGGGLAFKQMQHTFSIGVRYNLGLLDLADGSDSKNRVLSVVGTFEWPWGK